MSPSFSSFRIPASVIATLLLGCLSVTTRAQNGNPPSDVTPVLTITTVDETAREQSPYIDALPDHAELRVLRSGDLSEPLTVFYLVGGTAANGKDYAMLPGELQMPAGEEWVSIRIEALDDDAPEPAETVVVTLIPKEIAPDGQPPGYYHVGSPDSAKAFILDDEAPFNSPPEVSIVSPPPGAALPRSQEIQIIAEARDPDGWVASVEFFADGQSIGVAEGTPWSPGTIEPADAVNDPDWHPPHWFQIRWERPTPGPHVLTAVARDNLGAVAESEPVDVHLIEMPEPTVVHVIASDPAGGEGPLDDTLAAIPDPARFRLVRSGPLDIPLTVYFQLGGTAVNGVDYHEMASSAIIPEGKRSSEVIIRPIDDLIPERTEIVTLTIVPPICIEIFPPPPECYLLGTPARARVSIRDNDQDGNSPPRVRLVEPRDGQVLHAPAEVQLTAVAWDADGPVVSVEFFANEMSLGIATEPLPAPLPADLGDGNDPSLMLPRYVLGWKDVPAGRYSLTALALGKDGSTTRSSPVQLWVIGSSERQVVTVEASAPHATEAQDLTLPPGVSRTGRFTIHRTGPVASPLIVHYQLGGTALNGIDYEELPHRVLIPEGESMAHLEVRPLHDAIVEGSEHVELRLLPDCCPTDADGTLFRSYIVGEPSSARVTIHDDDANGNVPPRVSLARPMDGEVFVEPREIELVAVVRDPDGWVPAVQFYAGASLIGTSEIVFVREPDPGLSQTFTFNWQGVPPGRHILTARAVDDQGAQTVSAPVRISVRQSEVLQIVTIEATDPRASENGVLTVVDPAIFTVQRTGDLTVPLTVFYGIGGTAENGVDYQELPGVLEIPAGESSATIEAYPQSDNLEEDLETIIITLEPPMCPAIFPPPPGCYMVGEPGWALAGIVDGQALGNVPPHAEIVRPFPGAVYHAPARIPVVTQARDRDGYVTLVEWFANDRKIGEQNFQFIVPPLPGEIQVFEFNWRDAPAGHYLLTTRGTDELGAVSNFSESVPIEILPDQDIPVVTLFVVDPIASEQPSEDGSMDTATFRVRRSGRLNQPLTVFYEVRGTAENGVDYVTLSGQVTIPADNHWARIVVTTLNDEWVEDPETVVLELMPSPAMGPIEPYHVGSPKLAAALILDDAGLGGSTQRIRNWLHLQLPGETGGAYRLEVSENLLDWQAISEGWADASGMHHVESAPGDFPRRFYRLRPLAPAVMDGQAIGERDW